MAYNYVSFGLNTSDIVGLTAEQREAVELQVTISIVDEATWLYKNFRYPRYRNSYGYCQIMSGAYVIRSIQLEHLNQELLFQAYDTFDIDDNIGCAVKAILGALTPPTTASINISKYRSRVTGLRFRLYDGVQANVGIRWQTGVSNCANVPVSPDDNQGNPIPPNNGTATPGDRPADQGGDSRDPTANDGDPTSPVGPGPSPVPGNGGVVPIWHGVGIATLPGCATYTMNFVVPGATNPTIVPVYQVTAPNVCPGSTDGQVYYNGVAVIGPTGVRQIAFAFY